MIKGAIHLISGTRTIASAPPPVRARLTRVFPLLRQWLFSVIALAALVYAPLAVCQEFTLEGSVIPIAAFQSESSDGGFSMTASVGQPVGTKSIVSTEGSFTIEPPIVEIVQTPKSPTLALIVKNDRYFLQWNSVVPGWIVESTENLLPPVVWVQLIKPITSSADLNEMDLGPLSSTAFFRLRRQ